MNVTHGTGPRWQLIEDRFEQNIEESRVRHKGDDIIAVAAFS